MKKRVSFNWIDGGVTAPAGFLAAGVGCGIKKEGKDLALLYSEAPASASALLTVNRVKAAPVAVTGKHLSDGTARAVIANSGGANACTGEDGYNDAVAMCLEVAGRLGLDPADVAVASTGKIGVRLPIDKVLAGVAWLAENLSDGGGGDAAEAILTTDTRKKECALSLDNVGKEVRIGAMAKGAGMICPHMATMLAFITTDAAIEPGLLREALTEAVDASFNKITVDGDMSTNDTVICLANGMSGAGRIEIRDSSYEALAAGLEAVCVKLAREIVLDGEGATKFVEIRVRGASSDGDALEACRAIATSNLFKVALYGRSPNWGRIMAAIGASRAVFKPCDVGVFVGGEKVIEGGMIVSRTAAVLETDKIEIEVVLGDGSGESRVWTCDLSPEYVEVNI